jgi:YidC/Oxa1 family membrane protein insertase
MVLASGSFLDPIYNFFGAILAFFYSLIPSLGLAIVLLTVLVMLVLFPVTHKQAKAMLAMQRAQPEIKKIQAKYKNDRAKLNEELMKFYQENHINPLAGCLPLVIQMPVFIALYRVMRDTYKHIPKSSDLYAAFCTANGRVHKGACNVPRLGLPNHIEFLGMDLSQHATAVKSGFMDALPYFLLVGLVVLTGYLQSRQSRRNSPNMNSQMAMITTIMPIGFGVISLGFPAGLVLYFFISNLWRLGQQEVIMRRLNRPGAVSVTQVEGPDVIDVDPPGAPKPTGLRRLFQLPAATQDPAPGNGSGNGTTAAPAPKAAGNGRPTSVGNKGGTGRSAASASTPGGQRRKANKKRKRR